MTPNTTRVLEIRAKAWWGLGELKEAQSDFAKWIELAPRDSAAYLSRARFEVATKQFDAAIADLQKAKELDKYHAEVPRVTALLKSAKGDDAGAAKDMSVALMLNSGHYLNFATRGGLLFKAGKTAEAESDFELATRLYSNFKNQLPAIKEAIPTKGVAAAFLDLPKAKEPRSIAKPDLTTSTPPVKTDTPPSTSTTTTSTTPAAPKPAALPPAIKKIFDAGVTSYESGDYEKAGSAFKRVITLFPRYGESYLYRGLIYQRAGKTAEADRDFAQAVQIDPGLKSKIEQERGSKPGGSAADDFRKYVPEDAQFAVVFQPQKVWHSKLVTTLVPEKIREKALKDMKREIPVDPESIAKVAVLYSPFPAGFNGRHGDEDPSAYFTGVIQFNDSLKMTDRLKKVLEHSPMNTLTGLPGQAWWASRKDFDRPYPSGSRRASSAMKTTEGKVDYKVTDEKGQTTQKTITQEELEAEQKKHRDEVEAFHKAQTTPNQRLSEKPEAFDLCLFAPNDQTLVVGLNVRVAAVAKGSGASTLKDVLKDVDLAHDLILAGSKLDEFKPPEKALKGITRDPMAAMPVMMALGVLSQYKQLLLQIGASPGSNLVDLRVTAKDDQTAEQLEQMILKGKQGGKEAAGDLVSKMDPSANPPGKLALEEIEKNWKVTRTGAQLRLSIAHTEKLNELTIAAVQPAIAAAQAAGDCQHLPGVARSLRHPPSRALQRNRLENIAIPEVLQDGKDCQPAIVEIKAAGTWTTRLIPSILGVMMTGSSLARPSARFLCGVLT